MAKKGGRPIEAISLSKEEKRELDRRVKAPTATKREIQRAQIILLRAEGLSEQEVAQRLGFCRPMVSKWSSRFKDAGLSGLRDKPGRGRNPRLDVKKIEKVITEVGQPPEGYERWSVRLMAKESGISPSSVHRIWREVELKPHQTRVFKASNDPDFEAKFWDVIGLYLDPPQKALILSCDEKSQCQALERSQQPLPLTFGHRKTRTHDYIRHGTVTLFAALDYLEGKVFSRIEAQHTYVQWLRFLKQLERNTPKGLTLHLIVDNYATHKKQEVREWIERRNRNHKKQYGIDRIVLHFTPTSSSWMNLVERFFADLSQHAILEGSFGHVRELTRRIEEYIAQHNLRPKRYVWRAKGEEILEKIRRAREKIDAA